LTASLSSSSLSLKSSQLRFSVKGTTGSFEKYGLDVQEDQLKARKVLPTDAAFGVEGEDIAGVLEVMGEDGKIKTSKYVEITSRNHALFPSNALLSCH